jgi:hypothetical protein
MDNRTQFKIIDLTLFTILAAASEFMSIYFIRIFSEAGYVISFSFLISLIAIYRWGILGSIPYLVSGIVVLFINIQSDDIVYQIFYYVIANAMILFTPLLFKYFRREKIKNSLSLLFLYILFPLICITIGKGLMILIFEQTALGFIDYFATQLFTIVISYIILMIVVRIDGLLEDMNIYIQS